MQFIYIYDKENKTSFSNAVFKLKECLFSVVSKINDLDILSKFDTQLKTIIIK